MRRWLKMLLTECAVLLGLLVCVSPAEAQWQVPSHAVPIGQGAGVTGFNSVAPGTSGLPFVSQGALSDPGYALLANAGLANMAATTVKCNNTTVSASPIDCTVDQTDILLGLRLLANAQTGTTYTYLSTDDKSLVSTSNGSAIASTLTAKSSGFGVVTTDLGAGTNTITCGGCTINGAGTLAIVQGDGYFLSSDGSNFQGMEVGNFNKSGQDVQVWGRFTLFVTGQGNAANLNGNGTVTTSNYFAAQNIYYNYAPTHNGANYGGLAVTALGKGSGADGGSSDYAIAASCQQVNYLTTSTAGECDGVVSFVYHGVNTTGNAFQGQVHQRANGSSQVGTQAQVLEAQSDLVNGSAVSLARVHGTIGELDVSNSRFGFGAVMEAEIAAWDTAYLVDTCDQSAGATNCSGGGTPPSWQYALRIRSVRNNANDTFRLTAAGVISMGAWNGTAIGATFGGTGQTSYAVGDILYADTTTTLARLADVATGQLLASGGASAAPAYCAACTLTTSLTVPKVIGGTGVGSSLLLQSTSGVGSSDFIDFLVGNNGATRAGRINTDGNWTLGNTGSVSKFYVTTNTGTQRTTGRIVQVQVADSTSSGISISTYGALPVLQFERAEGTATTRTALTGPGTSIGQFAFGGFDGTNANQTGILFNGFTGENWSATAHGAGFSFFTTPNTTTATAEAARFAPSGGFCEGCTSDPGIGAILANTSITATTFLKTGTTTVGSLPTCNAGARGTRYFVTDGNTANAFRGAVTGGGALNQWVVCDGAAWLQG